MKYGVIDVGSNSVRLLINEDGKNVKKSIKTTRLAQGKKDGLLDVNSSLRTLKAISDFTKEAKRFNVDKIFAFATAAVRNSANGGEFVRLVKENCGIDIDVVSGETEAKLAYAGALDGKDGAVLDVGGGSTELAVVRDGELVYAKSVPLGAVVATERYGQNAAEILACARSELKEFGQVACKNLYCIGGTCTTLAAISLELVEYDAEKVDGYQMPYREIVSLAGRLASMSVESRKTVRGLQKERADIIHSGALIVQAAVELVGAEYITVKESDNLEGYLGYVTEKK